MSVLLLLAFNTLQYVYCTNNYFKAVRMGDKKIFEQYILAILVKRMEVDYSTKLLTEPLGNIL